MCSILNFRLAGLVIACLVLSGCVADPRHTDRIRFYRDWSVFAGEDLSGRECWAATTPTAQPSRFADGQTFIMVKTQPKEFSIVSESASFRNEVGSLVIGDKRYPLFFEGKNGWLRDDSSDFYIVRSLASALHNRIEVGGEVFAFSGAGFAEAFADANALCAE